MELTLESGYTSLNKAGEELCGDMVDCVRKDGFTTLVLADGLGSGVKANILATLTSKILSTMIANNVPMEECVEVLLDILPVCKVREVAYATFSVVHTDDNGVGRLFEFDNPQAILIHDGKCTDLDRKALHISGKTVYVSELRLVPNDTIVLMSDGAIHAGIGMILNFGWERKEIMEYLDRKVTPDMSARAVACLLATACNDLYLDKPGDDTTIAAVRVRERLRAHVMVGPPVHKEQDEFCVKRFLSNTDKTVVCGGTSSQIVARYLGVPIHTSFDFPDKDVPPIGFIDGVDLTTEGVLTLRRVKELSEKYLDINDLTPKQFTKKDGASLIAELLFEEATDVDFFVGQGVNEAHQGLPIDITMKLKLVEAIADNLKKMGKSVTVSYN